jgi:hypothetical protein
MTIAEAATKATAAAQQLRVCIHRGTEQIGGTCIELASQGQRILLDLGLSLDAGDQDPASLLPPSPGCCKKTQASWRSSCRTAMLTIGG